MELEDLVFDKSRDHRVVFRLFHLWLGFTALLGVLEGFWVDVAWALPVLLIHLAHSRHSDRAMIREVPRAHLEALREQGALAQVLETRRLPSPRRERLLYVVGGVVMLAAGVILMIQHGDAAWPRRLCDVLLLGVGAGCLLEGVKGRARALRIRAPEERARLPPG